MTDGRAGRAPAEAGYISELLQQWRPLAAATIGLAGGAPFAPYIAAIMSPHLLREFGWSRAQYASLGGLLLVGLIFYPISGRISDFFGVRRTALIGAIALPLSYVALSTLRGNIWEYAAIWVVQIVLGTTLGAMVYSRIVVRYIKRARGIAFAITGSGPALSGAAFGPLLNNFVEAHGWRSGYIMAAAGIFLASATALLLLPRQVPARESRSTDPRIQHSWSEYKDILSNKAFWRLTGAVFLCNLPIAIATSQLNVLLLEHGVSTARASVMIAALAVGTLMGRYMCGFALDRLPSNLVSAVGMGLPAVGLSLIALHLDTVGVLTGALFLIGFSFGAENDVLGYLVAKYFDIRNFGSVFGIMMAVLMTSSSLGAVILGYTLSVTDSFSLFLWTGALVVLLGSLMFLSLGPKPAYKQSSPLDAGPEIQVT